MHVLKGPEFNKLLLYMSFLGVAASECFASSAQGIYILILYYK